MNQSKDTVEMKTYGEIQTTVAQSKKNPYLVIVANVF